MSGLFGRVTVGGNAAPPQVAGFKVQTSVYGLPLPIVYGTARVAGNLIHFTDPKNYPQLTPGSRSKLVKVDQQITGYSYTAALALGLCEGPIAGVGKVWRDKESDTFANYQANLSWSLFLGSIAQSPWSYLSSNHPSEAVPYQLVAYVANPALDLPNNVLSNYGWEIQGFSIYGSGIVDANPKDVLVDYLTNGDHGVGFGVSQLGDLTAFSNYCIAMGLFLSPVVNGQRPAKEDVQEWLDAANSAAVWVDGVLTFVPYGDTAATGNGVTYTPNTTPVYDLTDNDFLAPAGTDPILVERKRSVEAFNQFTVEFEDRAHDYNPSVQEAKDQAAIEAYTLRPAPALRLPAIKTASTARLIAQLRLQRELNVRNTYRFTLPIRYALLTPMDLVTLTDPGLGFVKKPVRLIEVEEAETGDIACVAEDWPFGTATASRYGAPGAVGYAPATNVAPGSTTTPIILDAPYTLTSPDFQLWIAATGGASWGGCDVYFSTDTVSFRRVGSIVGKATMGALTGALAAGVQYPAVDTVDTAAVDLSASSGSLASVPAADADALLSLCAVDGEFLAYATAALTGPNAYNLTQLRRGLYGSAIPASHAIGAPFARLDSAVFRFSFPQGVAGQTVYFKFPAFNIYGAAPESLAAVASVPHTIAANPATSGVTLVNFRPINPSASATQVTYGWTRGPLTAEVWAGVVTFPLPLPADPWPTVRDAAKPLGSANTLTINKPSEGYVTLAQVVPLKRDLTEGDFKRVTVDAAPAGAPVVSKAYSKTATVGTLWFKLQRRGLGIVSVLGQTQIAFTPASALVTPTRTAGASSVVKGGVLGADEYEIDVTLDQTRLASALAQVTLSSGDVLVVGPEWFDRNQLPTIVSSGLSGTVITAIGDSDVKSWKAFDTGTSGWQYIVDGPSCVIDIAQPGTNGVAGQPSTATWAIRLVAYSEVSSAVTGSTPTDQRDFGVTGSGGTAAPTWTTKTLTAPAINTDDTLTIKLNASSAPAGYTMKLWERHVAGSGAYTAFADITAAVAPTPSLAAVAAGVVSYTYATGYPKSLSTGPAVLYTIQVRAEILNASGVVVTTATIAVSWYTGGGLA